MASKKQPHSSSLDIPMQNVCEQQYVADLARFPHLSDEEVRLLSQQIVVARQQHNMQAETIARQRLITQDGCTLDRDETALVLGLSREHVRGIETHALSFLRRRGEGKQQRLHFNNHPAITQARCEAAYAQLVAQGVCLTVPRLKATAHVSSTAARRFLRERRVPPAVSSGRPRGRKANCQ